VLNVSLYTGIPFVPHGRTLEGCDCWGLVRLVLKNEYGKDLPSFASSYGELEKEWLAEVVDNAITSLRPTKVDVPAEGDIVLMTFRGFPCHVGLYVAPNNVLHSDILGRDSSRLSRLSDIRIASRVRGFYRVV